jgi:hypothetical protein
LRREYQTQADRPYSSHLRPARHRIDGRGDLLSKAVFGSAVPSIAAVPMGSRGTAPMGQIRTSGECSYVSICLGVIPQASSFFDPTMRVQSLSHLALDGRASIGLRSLFKDLKS